MAIIVPSAGVVDFSYDRLTGAQLQTAGAAGVIRYACAGRSSVNITAAEYADFTAHGIPVGITCEQAATFMTSGRAYGRDYAQGALDVTRAAGMPDGPVFFAVDFPADQSYMPALLDTLNGCADVLGEDNAGIYGSYDVIDWLSKNSLYTAFWQTAAWSNGRTHPKAWLLQDRIWTQATPYKLDGANVDFSTVLGDWHPRQEDTLSQADVDAINAHTDNALRFWFTNLVGTRTLPKANPPTGQTSLAAIADALYLQYHGLSKDTPADLTHPGLLDLLAHLGNVQASVQEVQGRVANLANSGQPVDPTLAADIQNLTAALNGGLSWTVTTATPKAAK